MVRDCARLEDDPHRYNAPPCDEEEQQVNMQSANEYEAVVESSICDEVEQFDATSAVHVSPFHSLKFLTNEQFIITNSLPPLTIPPYIPLSTSFIQVPSTLHLSDTLPFSSPTIVIFSNKQSLNISPDAFPFIIKFAPTFIMSLKRQSITSISLPDEHFANEKEIEFRSSISCKLRYPPLLLNSESPVVEYIWHLWKERCDLSVSEEILEHVENKSVLTLVVELMNVSSSLFEINKNEEIELGIIFDNGCVSAVMSFPTESVKIISSLLRIIFASVTWYINVVSIIRVEEASLITRILVRYFCSLFHKAWMLTNKTPEF